MDDGEAIMREQGLRRDGGMEDERTCGRWAFGAFGGIRGIRELWETSGRGGLGGECTRRRDLTLIRNAIREKMRPFAA
ncbi:hypothetical protein HMSSN139_02690 [Paenibacillus sp. HMSSN-139]|nr:hypothetical protein HMSSN139_02690 [Paenibacillus sp. HMSSN-139]